MGNRFQSFLSFYHVVHTTYPSDAENNALPVS